MLVILHHSARLLVKVDNTSTSNLALSDQLNSLWKLIKWAHNRVDRLNLPPLCQVQCLRNV